MSFSCHWSDLELKKTEWIWPISVILSPMIWPGYIHTTNALSVRSDLDIKNRIELFCFSCSFCYCYLGLKWTELNWYVFSFPVPLIWFLLPNWNWLKLWNQPGVLFGVNFLKIIQDLCIWCVYVFVCEWERECEIIIYHFLFDAFLSIYCSNLSGSKIFETVENAWICCEITIIHT